MARTWGGQGGATHCSGRRAQVAHTRQTCVEAATKYQQSCILARVERIRDARARAPTELIGLVVVAFAVPIKRPKLRSLLLPFVLNIHALSLAGQAGDNYGEPVPVTCA